MDSNVLASVRDRGWIQYYKLAAGDLALLQHKWLWNTARGQEAKNEEMKVYEAPKKDCMDISMVILPGTDKPLFVAKYLSL